jgi:hypothetical protein
LHCAARRGGEENKRHRHTATGQGISLGGHSASASAAAWGAAAPPLTMRRAGNESKMLLIDHCMGISALAGARLGVSRPGAGRRCLAAAAARARGGAGPSGRSCCRHRRPKAAERCRRRRARFASKARSGRLGGDQFTPRGYGGGVESPRAAQGGGAHHRRVPAGFVYCVLAEKERALDQREQIHLRRRCCRRHNRRVVRRRRGGLGEGHGMLRRVAVGGGKGSDALSIFPVCLVCRLRSLLCEQRCPLSDYMGSWA